VEKISVIRGAPCGATWKAASRMKGLAVDEAMVRIGLETQFFCSADPSSWDPISGKSPVHLAGEFHKNAFLKSLRHSKQL